MNDVLLIIPAFNEEGNIARVCEGLKAYSDSFDYIVVNDGSTDATSRICHENGYPVIDLPVNLGLAGAFKTGMRYAMRKGYDHAVQFDGDGQHRPEYIADMRAAADRCDIVIASRFISGKKSEQMSAARSIGSSLISAAIRLTTGARITDPTSGMRMYNRRMIEEYATGINYPPEPDTLSYLIKHGAKAVEVPAVMDERISGESYLKPLDAAAYMLRMLTSILLIQNFRR